MTEVDFLEIAPSVGLSHRFRGKAHVEPGSVDRIIEMACDGVSAKAEGVGLERTQQGPHCDCPWRLSRARANVAVAHAFTAPVPLP